MATNSLTFIASVNKIGSNPNFAFSSSRPFALSTKPSFSISDRLRVKNSSFLLFELPMVMLFCLISSSTLSIKEL